MSSRIRKIGMLLLLITIVTFNLIIGANEKGLRIMPISILMAFIVVYLIIIKIKTRNESIFLKSKIDYLVLAFMLTTMLPIIFKTYVSYSDSVEFLMKYFFIYLVYVLARNVIKEKKQSEIIITATLICSFIPITLGIINRYFGILKPFMQWLNIAYNESTEFCGTFGYANTMAIYMAFCIFLAMHKIKLSQNKYLKVTYIAYIIIALIIIFLTKAKAVLILLGFTLFIIFIFKFRNKIIKYRKRIIIGSIVLIILTILYLVVAMQISKPIIENYNDVNQTIKYNFVKDNKYEIKLELMTLSTQNLNSFYKATAFEVEVLEGGKYFNDNVVQTKSLSDFEGDLKLEFIPTKDTDYIRIKIKNKFHGTIKLGDCYINGQKRIINYKYISKDVANLLKGYSITGVSIPQRIYMYQDCIKIAKDSPIIGNGGDTWKNVSRAVEDYTIALKECHSYFWELVISYGIIGMITFLIMIIVFFIKIFKQCKNNEEKREGKLFIALGLFVLLFHSITFDFNMSFMLIQLSVYIYMAVLLVDEKNNNQKYPLIKDIVIGVILLFILSLYIRQNISKYLITDYSAKHSISSYNKELYKEKIKNDIENNENCTNILNDLQEIMDRELYYAQNEIYKMYFDTLCNNIDKMSKENFEYYIDYVINRLRTVRMSTPLFFDKAINRAEIIKNSIITMQNNLQKDSIIENDKIDKVKNAIEKLKEIEINEYEINIRNMNNFEIHGYEDFYINIMKKQYEDIMKSVRKSE